MKYMLKALTRKRTGKVIYSPLKELNSFMWEYVAARENLTHLIYKLGNRDLADFAEESIKYCEITLGIGTNEGDIQQKIEHTKQGIKRLNMTHAIIETYSRVTK